MMTAVDATPILMKGANVGTTDGGGGLTSAHLLTSIDDNDSSSGRGAGGSGGAVAAGPPCLGDVAAQTAVLRRLLRPPGSPAASLASPSVQPAELDRIGDIVAALAPLERWAAEEGSHYCQLPSALAEVEAPGPVVACLLTRRPRIVTAALRAVAAMMAHGQTRSETLRAVSTLIVDEQQREGEGGEEVELPWLLAVLLNRSPGIEELCVAATEAAAALAAEAAANPRLTVTADAFLRGALVAEVLGALERHGGASVATAAAATRLLAAVAALPRAATSDNDEQDDGSSTTSDEGGRARELTPACVLLCHLGPVLERMAAAFEAHSGSSAVKGNVLDFYRLCAAQPQNRVRLLQCGAYRHAMRALSCPLSGTNSGGRAVRGEAWPVFAAAAEVACYFPPLLDGLQRRRFVLVVRRLLTGSGEPRQFRLALVMLLALLRSLEAMAGGAAAGGGRGGGVMAAYGAYGLYPQPPSGSRQPQHADPALASPVSLSRSEVLESVSSAGPGETLAFIRSCYLPQLLQHLGEYHRALLDGLEADDGSNNSDSNSTAEDELRAMRGVIVLAERCLPMMMVPMPM